MNSDDAVDEDERFVGGPWSAYPLPIKPLRLVGVAKWKPFSWANFASAAGSLIFFQFFFVLNTKSGLYCGFDFSFMIFHFPCFPVKKSGESDVKADKRYTRQERERDRKGKWLLPSINEFLGKLITRVRILSIESGRQRFLFYSLQLHSSAMMGSMGQIVHSHTA